MTKRVNKRLTRALARQNTTETAVVEVPEFAQEMTTIVRGLTVADKLALGRYLQQAGNEGLSMAAIAGLATIDERGDLVFGQNRLEAMDTACSLAERYLPAVSRLCAKALELTMSKTDEGRAANRKTAAETSITQDQLNDLVLARTREIMERQDRINDQLESEVQQLRQQVQKLEAQTMASRKRIRTLHARNLAYQSQVKTLEEYFMILLGGIKVLTAQLARLDIPAEWTVPEELAEWLSRHFDKGGRGGRGGE